MARIGIVGLGLIGASMGLALKKAKFGGVEIIGYDRDPEVNQRALKFGAIDREAYSVEELAGDSALVIVASGYAPAFSGFGSTRTMSRGSSGAAASKRT